MTDPTTLYRLYDAADQLLYVGIGGNPGRRFEQHRSGKPWWGKVARVTLEHHPTRESALAAEVVAIQVERPRYNIAGRAEPASTAPGWEHRRLPNGAYLDTEQRGDHLRVYVNRDQLTTELLHAGRPHEVPEHVAAAHARLAQVACRWLWAAGRARGEVFQLHAGRWRYIAVAAEHVPAAQRALAASELDGDAAALDRLAERLVDTFPADRADAGVLRQEALALLAQDLVSP
ncbi:GIY-YIG nuclease family protein [Nonomuraea turcica]|uniref:GIY-YIG nuclease family protein n=1 Tax=Nonomuraea sp. G32 TaxID=3067274 RepID=UPI00273BFC02|nr:GIY-YIG nuclease family protein [Nonomuraea sp. G32]MDP4501032.1 GIY-YIG nuclease family protein [Nonomuraea sp. G32]